MSAADRRDRTARAVLYARWSRFLTLLASHVLLEGRAACSLVRRRGWRFGHPFMRCSICERAL